MTAAELKTIHDTIIRQETGNHAITTDEVADILDALVDRATPVGGDGAVQYSDAGEPGGNANFKYVAGHGLVFDKEFTTPAVTTDHYYDFLVAKPIDTASVHSDFKMTRWSYDNTSGAFPLTVPRNEGLMMGFNLNSGGGPSEIGKPSIGISWEHNYLPDYNPAHPMVEMHKYYIPINTAGGLTANTQTRLESYTINTVTNNIDYYKTVGREYNYVPGTSIQYYVNQPGMLFTGDGAGLMGLSFVTTPQVDYGGIQNVATILGNIVDILVFQNIPRIDFNGATLEDFTIGNITAGDFTASKLTSTTDVVVAGGSLYLGGGGTYTFITDQGSNVFWDKGTASTLSTNFTTINFNGATISGAVLPASNTVAGSNTQIQYNNSGVFGASSNLYVGSNGLANRQYYTLEFPLSNGSGLLSQNQTNGDLLFQFGFNAQAQYGGTAGATSGSQFFVYNFQEALGGDNSYYWGFNNNGDNYYGSSNTLYSVRVQQPRAGNIPLTLMGVSGQTEDLFNVTKNGGSAGQVLTITANGSIGIGVVSPNASALVDMTSTTQGFLAPRHTTTEMNAVSSPATGLEVYNTDALMNLSYNGSAFKSSGVVSGTKTATGTATTTFTVTFGGTQPNTTYKVNVTPSNSLSAALFYVNNKTTTTFDVVYLAGLTGSVEFDWAIFQ